MAKTARERILTLRDEFDGLLSSLGVDCFTIYAEDLWQPGEWIPQEVDTALYYPEAAYAGPTENFAKALRREIAVQARARDGKTPKVDGVRGAFFQDARAAPRLYRSALPPHPSKFRTLYAGFVEREEIQSSAVFMPRQPRIPGNTKKEILFFNFRSAQTFESTTKEALLRLADLMLRRVPDQVRDRNKKAYAPARIMIRAFTSLLKEVNSQLNNPSRNYDRTFFDTIATRLCDVLNIEGRGGAATDKPADKPADTPTDTPTDKATSTMIVSIYVSEASDAELPVANSDQGRYDLEKRPTLHLTGSSMKEPKKHKLPAQPLYTDGSPSITTCTTMTGGPLMLHRIDPYWPTDASVAALPVASGTAVALQRPDRITTETSLELTREQLNVASCALVGPGPVKHFVRNSAAATTSLAFGWGFSIKENDTGTSGPAARLILHTPTPEDQDQREERCNALLGLLAESDLGTRWPVLVDKARRRMKCQYSHIFGPLDKDWEPPSAEVCVPIRFAGQTIGCVNIESKAIDRFPPTVIGLLTSLAAMIGTAVARNRDIEMMDRLDEVTHAIHTQPVESEIPASGTAHAPSGSDPSVIPTPAPFHIRDDRYKLCALAKSVARACGADMCSIVRTGLHQDDPTRYLATSSFNTLNDVGWPLPRFDGWTKAFADKIESAPWFVGQWVSRFSDERGTETSPGLFWLTSDPNKGAITFESVERHEDTQLSEKLVPSNTGLLSILIPSGLTNEGGRGRTIVALTFSRRMFDDPPAVGATVPGGSRAVVTPPEFAQSEARREQFLGYVYSVCKRLGLVAAHWGSHLFQKLTEAKDVRHSEAFQNFRDAIHCLAPIHQDPMIVRDDKRDGSPAMIADILRSFYTESEIAQTLSQYSRVTSRSFTDLSCHKADINTIITKSWRVAAWLCTMSPPPEPQKTISDDLRGCTHDVNGPFLYFLLLQIFVNSMRHGNSVSPAHTLVATGTCEHSDWVIEDVGRGFPPSMVPGMPEYNRRMPPLITGKVGRGFDMMLRAARVLNPNALAGQSLRWSNYGDPDPRGTRIEFTLTGWKNGGGSS